jgi:ABC-type glycerol-3-phosphate transport system substrate-binding protein
MNTKMCDIDRSTISGVKRLLPICWVGWSGRRQHHRNKSWQAEAPAIFFFFWSDTIASEVPVTLSMQDGCLSDLSEFVKRDQIDLDDYYPCIRGTMTDRGRFGALPVMAETIGVYYNKGHFDEAGLPYPNEG